MPRDEAFTMLLLLYIVLQNQTLCTMHCVCTSNVVEALSKDTPLPRQEDLLSLSLQQFDQISFRLKHKARTLKSTITCVQQLQSFTSIAQSL